MTVLQINVVYDEKSTGRTCKEVETFLKEKGVRSVTAYGVGEKNKGADSYRIENRAEYYFHNIMSRITGLEGYFSYFATKRLIRFIKKLGPDIIHLRNLHGHYLNLPLFFKFLKETQIPVVINLHDCWIFTGKCTYPVRENCEKWCDECKNCEYKGYPQSLFFDFSKKMFNDKKKFLSGLNVKAVVGVSDWVASQAKMSFLSGYPITYIYNWINSDVFKNYNSKSVLEQYKADTKKFTVICVAAAWSEGSKKNRELEELSRRLKDTAQIIVVGKKAEGVKGDNIIPIDFVSDTGQLARLYSAADVYVHLSAADTFGKVIAEAMACGTPAVAYDCTAITELITEGCGYLAPLHDVEKTAEYVLRIMENGKEAYSADCVKRVKKDFDYHTNCEELLKLYVS